MTQNLARAALLIAAVALAGCNESLEDISPKAERQLPAKLVNSMKAKDMSVRSPIMLRIFKEEGVLEVWKQKGNGRYALATSYDICKWSGKLGPKFTEGDRQAPEGFYNVRPAQMNPKSSYHLSFNIGFPNTYDRVHGRTGANLMVHGACSSAGCYSMTDEQVEEIYAFARDAFRGGQEAFQIQAFPFRMTPENMARYRDDPNFAFWKNLKEGYDYFEITKLPPKVDVCERRYVFNQYVDGDGRFSPSGACPAATQPDSLRTAYSGYQTQFESAFSAALEKKSLPAPTASITNVKEAALVADWSRRRARGEKVTREPPSLQPAVPAAAPVPVVAPRAEPELEPVVATVPEKPAEPTAAPRPAADPQVADAARDPEPTTPETAAAAEETPKKSGGLLSAPKKALGRIRNLFGG